MQPQPVYKDPAGELDYSFDWGEEWLDADETLVSSAWSAPEGLTIVSDSFTTTTTTVWLSGGTNLKNYRVTNWIVTSFGRSDERSLLIQVRNR
jgi:hypothetical protein